MKVERARISEGKRMRSSPFLAVTDLGLKAARHQADARGLFKQVIFKNNNSLKDTLL